MIKKLVAMVSCASLVLCLGGCTSSSGSTTKQISGDGFTAEVNSGWEYSKASDSSSYYLIDGSMQAKKGEPYAFLDITTEKASNQTLGQMQKQLPEEGTQSSSATIIVTSSVTNRDVGSYPGEKYEQEMKTTSTGETFLHQYCYTFFSHDDTKVTISYIASDDLYGKYIDEADKVFDSVKLA